MKTKQLRDFEKNISELNNCYSHYLLVWEQFQIDHIKDIECNGEKLTTDIFKENPNSTLHNVKLNHLDSTNIDTQNLILKSIYLLSFSYFEHYLIRLHQFSQQLDNTIIDLQQKTDQTENETDYEDKKVFDKFFNRLKIDKHTLFSDQELTTMDYLRIRRNRITHIALDTQGAILDIINHKGQLLNNFWDKNLRNKRFNLDFKRKNIDLFNSLELFDILNIYRRITAKIDQAYIDKISQSKMKDYILKDFLSKQGINLKNLTPKRKLQKFKHFCKAEYSINITTYDFKEILF